MTGAIYVRYSPRIEPDQSFTLENQISMCREFTAKMACRSMKIMSAKPFTSLETAAIIGF